MLKVTVHWFAAKCYYQHLNRWQALLVLWSICEMLQRDTVFASCMVFLILIFSFISCTSDSMHYFACLSILEICAQFGSICFCCVESFDCRRLHGAFAADNSRQIFPEWILHCLSGSETEFILVCWSHVSFCIQFLALNCKTIDITDTSNV